IEPTQWRAQWPDEWRRQRSRAVAKLHRRQARWRRKKPERKVDNLADLGRTTVSLALPPNAHRDWCDSRCTRWAFRIARINPAGALASCDRDADRQSCR